MARVEIFHERARRRWTAADKRRLVAETLAPGETVHGVARRHGVNTSQLFTWRKQLRVGLEPATASATAPAVAGFAAVAIAPSASPADGMTPGPLGLIEIELAGGDRVRISGAPDPAVVAATLRALAGR
jgi:transposase